jgi:hypothetical protein
MQPQGFNTQGSTPGYKRPNYVSPTSLTYKPSIATTPLATAKTTTPTTPAKTSGLLNLSNFTTNLTPAQQQQAVKGGTALGLSTSAPTTPTPTPTPTSTQTPPAGNTYNPTTGLYTSGNVVTGGVGANTSSQNQTQAQQTTPTTTTTTPTFSGLLGDITSAAQTSGEQVTKTAEQIADIQKQAAQAQGSLQTSGELSPVAQGRGAVIGQTAAAQEAALQSQLANQLQAGQQAISAYGTAAGLAQPQLGAYGQTYYNPMTGTTGSGEVAQTDPFYKTLQTYAQLRASGQETQVPSSISGNAVLNAQVTKMAQAINPSYNANVTGALGTSAADLATKASELQANMNGAEANFDLLKNIAKQGGVNDNNVPILNTLQNNVSRGLTSNDSVVSFQSLIQGVRSQYAAVLGGGTVTVESLNEAKSLIPDDVSLSALDSLGVNLKSDAANRIAGIQNQIKSLTSGGTQTSGGTSWANIAD